MTGAVLERPTPSTWRGDHNQPIDRRRELGLELLRKALDNPSAQFRDGQWEAIETLVNKRARMLVVQRTGWGKSLVYFVTTRLLREAGAGPTLLISPLLSLMRNQLAAANRLGVRAGTINSNNRQDWPEIHARLKADDVDVLLISPERLSNEDFREEILPALAPRIGFFVVDEAHCISDWGHDFRPDYLRIARILQALPPNIPALATTATANNRVVADVQAQLGSNVIVSRGPLVRESLRLQNVVLQSQASRMAWLAEKLPQIPGTGIIYTLTVADAQNLAGWLQSRGIEARAYWGALEADEREELEERLLANDLKCLVATTALGMGFDKPDLGFVIHFQRPGSVVHYYQQVGRAGRAIDNAYGVLLSGSEDQEIVDYFIQTAFPPEAHIDAVLRALYRAPDGKSISGLERDLNLTRGQIEKVLKCLAVRSPAPVAREGYRWYATPVVYTPDREKVTRLTALRQEEQKRMTEYIQNRDCLMRFLERELDDPEPEPCGKCAVCTGEDLLSPGFSQELALTAVDFLRRGIHPIEPRQKWPEDSLASHGWRGIIPRLMRAEEGRALSLWGDDGWGLLVRQGKQKDGRFSSELAGAVASLVRDRWHPLPAPAWLTCVPSLNHPTLVPDLARRVARRLGLPFVECISKVRHTRPQKEMENNYQQAHNLANAFKVDGRLVRGEPVLLLDDMVDSGWTFTVLAALLREAGSGPVYPVALSSAARPRG